MNDLLLVVAMAGRTVALPGHAVHSVIELEGLTPIPRAPAHVAGLAALRSRILTAIDCRRALGFPGSEGAAAQAVVCEIDGHGYALMVDAVEDVTPALSLPAALSADLGPGWNAAALGMVETALGPLLLVDAAALVRGTAPASPPVSPPAPAPVPA